MRHFGDRKKVVTPANRTAVAAGGVRR